MPLEERRRRYFPQKAKPRSWKLRGQLDLSPLATRYDEFRVLKEQHLKDLRAFDEARRRVSSVRRRVLVKITLAQEQELPVCELVVQLAGLPRLHARTSPEMLERILTTINELETALDIALSVVPKTCGQHQKTSDRAEQNFRHIQPTNNPQSSKDDTCNRLVSDDREGNGNETDPASTGIEHLKPWQVMAATSENFSAMIEPAGRKVRMSDVVDAAARYCQHLGIHRTAWADTCSVMGRDAAAVAVIIIERNQAHPKTPVIKPGGVLRSLTNRARVGELNLHLHRSIFGILDRDAKDAKDDRATEGGAS